jgi:hypothetical protein
MANLSNQHSAFSPRKGLAILKKVVGMETSKSLTTDDGDETDFH